MKDVFSQYYQNNYWADDESVSGHGSTLTATATIREKLPELFRMLGVRTVLDIPCGDFNWAKEMDLSMLRKYIGADVVPEMIERNRELYERSKVDFAVLDITKDWLPQVDLVLVRDLLGHFSNLDVKHALQNLRTSGSKWLLATTFPKHTNERDIRTGEWRPINLASYFGLPDPGLVINEGCTDGGGKFIDKSLGLWKLRQE